METVRQLALTKARRKTMERAATVSAQMKAIKKRQLNLEEQIRRLIVGNQQFGGNVGVGGQDTVNEEEEEEDEFDHNN